MANGKGSGGHYRSAISGRYITAKHGKGSCPRAWCSWIEADTGISGFGRNVQAVTADSLTIGSSLKGAIVASVM